MANIKRLNIVCDVLTDDGLSLRLSCENTPGPSEGLQGLGQYVANKLQEQVDKLFVVKVQAPPAQPTERPEAEPQTTQRKRRAFRRD